MNRYDCFAVCPPGLEDVTRAELFALGINHPRAQEGGVSFQGFDEHLYRVNAESRTVSRVLVRLGTFPAVTFAELEERAWQLPWWEFLRPGTRVQVRVTCHRSRLYHTDAVAERVVRTIQNKLKNVSHDPAGQLVVVRLTDDVCTVSLDSSGAHLHQRGYRLQVAKSPLRESLAATLLQIAGYDGTVPFFDPCCGSGTLPIEAALIAGRVAPGLLGRDFAFLNWQRFDSEVWARVQESARAKQIPISVPIHASDRDAGAVEATIANAARAGVAISCVQQSLSAARPTAAGGLLLTNLPFGNRLHTNDDLRNLYAALGNLVRREFAHWRVGFLAGDPILAGYTGLPLSEPTWLLHGGDRVPFYMVNRGDERRG